MEYYTVVKNHFYKYFYNLKEFLCYNSESRSRMPNLKHKKNLSLKKKKPYFIDSKAQISNPYPQRFNPSEKGCLSL